LGVSIPTNCRGASGLRRRAERLGICGVEDDRVVEPLGGHEIAKTGDQISLALHDDRAPSRGHVLRHQVLGAVLHEVGRLLADEGADARDRQPSPSGDIPAERFGGKEKRSAQAELRKRIAARRTLRRWA
jgi:hypothetical protein